MGHLHCGMQDLVPWPRDRTLAPALGVQSLCHWTTRESLDALCVSLSLCEVLRLMQASEN